MTITTHLLAPDGTVVKELTGLADRGWTHPRLGAGAGSLTIRNDHPDFSALSDRRLIRCSLDGTPVFSWMLQRRSTQRLSQDGPGGKVTVWTGAGALAALGMGQHHAAVVVGDGDSGLQTIGWVSRNWDDSAWLEPTDRGFVTALLPADEDFPDDEAQFLGSAGGGAASYLRRFLDVSLRPEISSDDIPVRAYIVGKGAWTFWWDGVQLAQGEPWQVVTVELGPLQLAGHQIAILCESGSAAISLIGLDADGELTGVLYRSFTQAVYGTGSAEPWVALEDGAVPADVTAGLVAKTLIDQAKARGALAGVTYDFTATADSNGVPWSVGLPIVTYRDGQQVGDVVMQLTQQFSVDVQMGPDLTLHIYESLGSDLTGSVELTDGTAGAAAASMTVDGVRGNVVRIGTSGGFGWDGGASGVPAGATFRLESAAQYGTASSVDEVVNAAGELIDDLRGANRQTITNGGPAGKRPYVNFGVGDVIHVREAAGGAYRDHRVEAITVLDLPAGVQEFAVDVERRL